MRLRAGLLTAGLLVFHIASAQPLLEALVPAYFDPVVNPSAWNTLAANAGKIPLSVIMNPASGPGSVQDASYVTAVQNVRVAGGHVLGYVSTAYGTRPIADVMNDINLYIAWYAIDGIFVDEMSSDANSSHYSYYQSLYQQIKAINYNYRVIGNPGTNTQEAYLTLPTADALVVFESTAKNYSKYVPSTWIYNYNRQYFANLVYAMSSSSQLGSYLNLAVSRNAGLVYLTSDSGRNPWDTLPGYWDTEVNCIANINAGLSC
ncbi:MAG: spherulation-specific family 4 protein [Sulfuriferula sp.]|nr:spherulation-specific family 4 protein [Sulfuriferula sp.]